jgi:acetyl-CoA acetyltransferase
MAYEQAGIGPQDLSLIECHDAFTISELLYYEALGLCARGEAPQLLASGATTLGGKIPVNPSGGLIAKGHPPAPRALRRSSKSASTCKVVPASAKWKTLASV